MMGSQPSSNFLGIEVSSFSFSSLPFMRAFVICFVKAKFTALALGLLASFCKNFITSEMWQSSKSKSLQSKAMGLSSPRLEKISAVLSQAVSAVLAVSGNFARFALGVETLPTPIILPLIVGGAATCGALALLVVVIVQTLATLLSLASFSFSSLSHLARNSAINLIFSLILTWMAFAVVVILLSISLLGITFNFKRLTSEASLSTLEAIVSILSSFSSTDLLKAVCVLINSLSMASRPEGTLLLLL